MKKKSLEITNVELVMPCGKKIDVKPRRRTRKKDLRIRPEEQLRLRVIHLLDRLGTTPTEWRKQLFRDEIQGLPGYPGSCVLAQYLKPHFPKYLVTVGRSTISLVRKDLAIDRSPTVLVDLPHRETMSRFVGAFDNHRYPELNKNSRMNRRRNQETH